MAKTRPTRTSMPTAGGTQVTISAPGGGSPASLGSSPGARSELMIRLGMAITSGRPPLAAPPVRLPTRRLPLTRADSAPAPLLRRSQELPRLSSQRFLRQRPRKSRARSSPARDRFRTSALCAPAASFAGRCGAGMLDATRALQAAGPPLVVTPPANVTVAAGATASFTVEAIGAVSYQWIRNGVAIAGATGP